MLTSFGEVFHEALTNVCEGFQAEGHFLYSISPFFIYSLQLLASQDVVADFVVAPPTSRSRPLIVPPAVALWSHHVWWAQIFDPLSVEHEELGHYYRDFVAIPFVILVRCFHGNVQGTDIHNRVIGVTYSEFIPEP